MENTSTREFTSGSNSRHAHFWHRPMRSKISLSRFKILSPHEEHLEVIGGCFGYRSCHRSARCNSGPAQSAAPHSTDPSPGPGRLMKAPSRVTLSPAERAGAQPGARHSSLVTCHLSPHQRNLPEDSGSRPRLLPSCHKLTTLPPAHLRPPRPPAVRFHD